MTALSDSFSARNTAENPDSTAGTSNVSQNAPAIWRSNSVVHSPPVNVAVRNQADGDEKIVGICPVGGVHVGIHEGDAEGRQPHDEDNQKGDGQNGKLCLPDPHAVRRAGRAATKRC